jgi:hypothetical protein
VKRSIAVLAATAGLLVFASTAVAGEALPTDSSTTPTTSTPTTSTPTTSTPATTTTTSVPTTTTTTTVPTTTTTTAVPTTTDTVTDTCVVDCIPDAGDCVAGADCLPSAGGGIPTAVGAGALPFTGIEDMILPILLGLTVVLGGVVAWRWAQIREAMAEAASRARDLPARNAVRTGYAGATRQLFIEQRARQVFIPRVA